MGRFLDWWNGGVTTSLDLKRTTTSPNGSTLFVPQAPVLDVSPALLARFARQSELVYACIEKKAQSATDPELVVQKRNKEGEYETILGHPAAALFNHPNPYDTGEAFMRAWIASENVSGVFYAQIVQSRAGLPVQLIPLIPTFVVPQYKETSAGRVLEYYSYFFNGHEYKFSPTELLVRRRHSFGSVFSGLTPLQVALNTVDADMGETEYVRAFFNNGGAPSGIINITGRKMSDAEIESYNQRWMSKFGRGGSNRGGPAVLDGTQVEYTPVGSKLDELSSDSLTSINESRICMAFGVPPILIGAYVGLLHVNQRASVREAQEDFWMNTMSPELKGIRKFLDHILLPMFEDPEAVKRGEFRFFWDMSSVDALQEEMDDAHKRVGQAYKDGIYTLNEARTALSLAADTERGDEYYKAPPAIGTIESEKPKVEKDTPKGLLIPIGEEDLADAERLKAKIEEELALRLALFGDGSSPDIKGILSGTVEKKTEYSREPTDLELTIDLKKIESDQATEQQRLFGILMTLRSTLIDSAVDAYGGLTDADIAQLSILPPTGAYKQIRRILTRSLSNGQMQVIDELLKQGAEISATATQATADLLAEIERIVELAVSNMVNEVQSRAVNQVVSFRLLGKESAEIATLLKGELESQSDAWINDYAGSTVNVAVQYGRDFEMEQEDKQLRVFVYSGILDKSICPECLEWDGEKRSRRADLPPTPNPDCKGGRRCRCFVIAVYDGDSFEPIENEVR